MKEIRNGILYVVLPIVVALTAVYFVRQLDISRLVRPADIVVWLVPLSTVFAVLGAYLLGERQAQAAWESVLGSAESRAEKAEAALMRIATAAHSAIELLDDRYRDTHQDRMRLRVVYFADTFSTLIEALSAIPVQELKSVEAVIALVGMRKNMTEAQLLIERYVADQAHQPDSAMMGKGLDLRACKAHASSHYQQLVRTLKTD